MARRLSKKKRPMREDKMMDEDKRIEARVFDRPALKILSKFIGKGLMDAIDNPIKMGKEANLFRGVKNKDNAPFKYYAVKIYRVETTSFRKMMPYIQGDPRFKNIKKTHFDFISIWTKKEYVNLKTAYLAGADVPEPVAYHDNVIIMSFLGEEGIPYPTLNTCTKDIWQDFGIDKNEFFKALVSNFKKIANAGLVHADFSEYNIIVTRKGPVIIDMAQSVSMKHPKAKEFLERDIESMERMCAKWGAEFDKQELMKSIKQ